MSRYEESDINSGKKRKYLSLNLIVILNLVLALTINIAIYLFIDNLIGKDFEAVQNSIELQKEVELKLLFLFISTSIIYILIGNKLIFGIRKELVKIENYLEKGETFKLLKSIFYSQEFINIRELISKIFKKNDRLKRKKIKFNSKLKVINYQQEKLLGAISHELKNPMSSILGYAQILKDEFNDEVQPTYIKFLDKIINNGRRVDELLDRLRLAVQLDNSKFELKYRVFNIVNLINEIVDNFESSRKIIIQIQNYELYADKTLIELVLINLIENAVKYSDGDIIIKMSEDCLKVIDYGIGINETELTSVTKRFYRVNRETHKQSIGLGLAIVSYILKLHNLKLDIESRVGTGSIFSINFSNIKNRILPKEIQPI